MPKTRTFIAVDAGPEVRTAALAAIDRLRSATDNVKWVAPQNLHWTLQFLGDLTDQQIADVCARTVRTVAGHRPFPISAGGVGAFPKPQRPRTLWLGVGQGDGAFRRLQTDVEESLADLGFRGERRQYVPHLTLGRVGRGRADAPLLADRLSRLADFDGGAMLVDEVTVFASRLERDGPVYHVLASASLGST